MSLHEAAQHLAARGRGEDKLLIHMTPAEVSGLDALARAHGHKGLTFNPETGLPEAGILSSILPMLIGAGLTVASGGTINPLMAAGITGVGFTAATGSLQKGLMAGLGAYGGGSIGAGIADMGAGSLASEAAAPQLATLNNAAGSAATALAGPELIMEPAAESLANLSGAQDAYAAAYQGANPGALDSLTRGARNAFQPGGLGALANNLGGNAAALKYAGMAAAPLFADQAVPRPATTTQAPQGMVRPMQFTRRQIPGGQQAPGGAFTGERQFFDDRLVQLPAYSPSERGYASGGRVMDVPGFADGGVPPEGWAVNGNNWYRNGEVYSPAQAQAMIAAAAPPPAFTVPEGWARAGDQFYRIDPVAGGQNGLTTSQAAYLWGVENPAQYLPTPTPAPQNYPPSPPSWATPEDGTGYTQMQRSWLENNNTPYDPGALASQQLLASGYNPNSGVIPTETGSTGRVTTLNVPRWVTPTPTPAPGPETAPPAASGGSTLPPAPLSPAPVSPPAAGGSYVTPPSNTPAPVGTPPPWAVPGPPTPPGGALPPPAGTPNPTPSPVGERPIGGNPAPPPGPPIGGPSRDLSVTLAMPWGSAARDYFMQNPDVADAFRTNNFGMSADDFARQHFEKFGRDEGRYFRGLSQPRVTRANPMNTTKGASRNALEYLAGEAPLAPQAGNTQYQPPSLAGIDKLVARTAETVAPDAFAESYLNRYPDVYLAFKKDPMGMDVNEFVRQHYMTYGQKEGRVWELPTTNGIKADGSNGDPANPGGGGYASGGIAALGMAAGGRLLRGPGDGVSDSIPATINNGQPAKLADGEFVVPARIVSELGNGSTEAGARQLYAMLDRIQKRRGATTGKGKVAVDSQARTVLPA